MFLLKKIVSALLNPLPVCLLLLLVGVVLLWRGKRPKWGRRFTTAGFAVLLLLSFELIPGVAMRALENDHPVYTPAQHPDVAVRWVVVLAGGVRDEPGLPPNEQLTASSLARLVEGIRILQFYPDAHLLLTGKGYFSDIPEAIAMRGAAGIMGVDSARVHLEMQSVDTADQAVNVRRIVGDDPFVLVTSAMHLRRALALFRKQGMDPLPAPARYRVRFEPSFEFSSFFPGAGNLSNIQTAWHEYLGLLWGRLTGQL